MTNGRPIDLNGLMGAVRQANTNAAQALQALENVRAQNMDLRNQLVAQATSLRELPEE